MRFYTSADLSTSARLGSNAGSWSSFSDRNAKANFAPVDGGDILERLAEMPLSTWNYKAADPSIRHLGPMAQDFYAAFGLGDDDKYISTVDADGVALSAIQGLYQMMQEQATQIEALEARLAALEGTDGVKDTTAGLLSSRLALPWLLLGGLVVGLVIWKRRFAGGRR